MSRRPKPWYRRERRSWYVTVDGVRHDLGADKPAAFARFHELMAQPIRRRPVSQLLVALIDAYLEWCAQHRAPDTYIWYRDRLQRFAEVYPQLTVRDLRPFHVQQWLDRMTGVVSGTKRNYCRAVKRVLRWAEQQGYIDRNPIAHLEQPKGGRRETVVSPDEFQQLLALVTDAAFRDLLTTTWETGCRPQELLRVEARHVDLKHRRWVFPESEAKGGWLRIVYLTDSALATTRRLLLQHPTGRLYRNSAGKAWTTDAVNCAFVRLQVKMGRQRMKAENLQVRPTDVAKLASTLSLTRTVQGQVVQKSTCQLKQEARYKQRLRLATSLAQILAVRAATLVGHACVAAWSRRVDRRDSDGTPRSGNAGQGVSASGTQSGIPGRTGATRGELEFEMLQAGTRRGGHLGWAVFAELAPLQEAFHVTRVDAIAPRFANRNYGKCARRDEGINVGDRASDDLRGLPDRQQRSCGSFGIGHVWQTLGNRGIGLMFRLCPQNSLRST
jgi:integrase